MNHTNGAVEPKTHGKHKFGPEYVSHELLVTGVVKKPLCLTVDDLCQMASVEIKSLAMICGSGSEKGTIESYRGVLLRDVLEQASVVIADHHAPNRLFLKLISNDGYITIFSYQEVFNTAVGEKAVVLFERDGEPLGDSEGDFAFISANDYRTGPRRMRYLSRIELCEVA